MSTWAPVRSALPRANCDGVREPSVLCAQSCRGEEPSRRKAASMGRPNSPSALTRAGPSTQRNGPANSRYLREVSFSAGAPPVAERFEIVADSPLYSFKIAINTEHHSTAWGCPEPHFLAGPGRRQISAGKIALFAAHGGICLEMRGYPTDIPNPDLCALRVLSDLVSRNSQPFCWKRHGYGGVGAFQVVTTKRSGERG